MTKRRKKYNPHKASKLMGRGAEFGSMSYDVDKDDKMVIRCNHKKITLNELQALRQARKWNILVTIFLESQTGDKYQENVEGEFNSEHSLEWIVDNYIAGTADELLASVNPNHYKYWGWHAEAL